MIQYAKGDLLQSDAQALVNTVNTDGVMGKGIALQFKEMFPENYRLYHAACLSHQVHVGEMFVTVDNALTGKKIIINFPTKTTWRRPSEYDYIESGLQSLRSVIMQRQIQSIAIPPLGSHNGGLDWPRVKEMIEIALQDVDCTVYLYEPSDAIAEKMKNERVSLTPARAMMLDLLCDMVVYGEFASVFAAEKIAYFLQRLGAANIFKVNYVRYLYGPYSKGKISHVLYYLNGSYVKGMSGMQAKPFDEIWILPDTGKTIADYLAREENGEYKAICEKTKAFLRGYYSCYSLELLSSVDFILQNNPKFQHWRGMDETPLVEAINADLMEWSDRKSKMFGNSRYIPLMVEHLRSL